MQGWLQVLAEYSTIDTTELVLGALLAGNYFGGRVAELANQVYTTIHYHGLYRCVQNNCTGKTTLV